MGYFGDLDVRTQERGAKPGTVRYLRIARKLRVQDCEKAFGWRCAVCLYKDMATCPRRRPVGRRDVSHQS